LLPVVVVCLAERNRSWACLRLYHTNYRRKYVLVSIVIKMTCLLLRLLIEHGCTSAWNYTNNILLNNKKRIQHCRVRISFPCFCSIRLSLVFRNHRLHDFLRYVFRFLTSHFTTLGSLIHSTIISLLKNRLQYIYSTVLINSFVVHV